MDTFVRSFWNLLPILVFINCACMSSMDTSSFIFLDAKTKKTHAFTRFLVLWKAWRLGDLDSSISLLLLYHEIFTNNRTFLTSFCLHLMATHEWNCEILFCLKLSEIVFKTNLSLLVVDGEQQSTCLSHFCWVQIYVAHNSCWSNIGYKNWMITTSHC